MVPKTAGYVALYSQRIRRFSQGNNVDIVGVTGSIPVTPTIRNPWGIRVCAIAAREIAKYSLGSMNLGRFA